MKILTLLSGGLDSAVLAAELIDQRHEVESISFNYGQRHSYELEAARRIAERLVIPHVVVTLPLAELAPTSSQTNKDIPVPLGHYQDPTMRATVVPNRNMVLMALALARAVAIRAGGIAYAAHAGDHAVYPDCRPEFYRAMRKVAGLCDYEPLDILAPFITMTKANIVARGRVLGAPLGLSYSCYQGGPVHCGECGTCVERREAFDLAGVLDPTEYLCPAAHAA